MEIMTMSNDPMPMNTVPSRRTDSFVHALQTFGAMPLAAASGSSCTWSAVADVTKNRTAAAAFHARTIGRKAYGNRRLGEPAST